MKLVVDASVVASWLLKRTHPHEIAIADRTIELVQRHGVKVPGIWPIEIANTLLTAERRGISTVAANTKFLADLATLNLKPESVDLRALEGNTIRLARSLQLTAYDATYLELALRTNASLATFDRKLAEACLRAGGHVYGDTP